MKKFIALIILAVITALIIVYLVLGRLPGQVETTDTGNKPGSGNTPGIIPPEEIGNGKKHPGKGFKISPVDKAEMIRVPAGTFYMGALDRDRDAEKSEKPGMKIYLDEFYIYKNEVTIGQYEKFISETGYFSGDDWKIIIPKKQKGKKGVDFYLEKDSSDRYNPNMPVINISWEDALAYCRWAGVMLPTEAQWEKACRGSLEVVYPWGNEADPARLNCIDNKNIPENEMAIIQKGRGVTHIGLFQKGGSRTGANDMAGNAAEWCLDYYLPGYFAGMPAKNPDGPDRGKERVIKGGSWKDHLALCRVSRREGRDPLKPFIDVGFRGVWSEKLLKPKGLSDKKDGRLSEMRKNPKDGAIMILIPGGEFTMGSKEEDRDADSDEKPQVKVKLKPYYIYKYEVTNVQFNRFVQETGYKTDGEWKLLYSNFSSHHPVTEISYPDAVAYAKWAGGRLPTEAEWEKAARGTDGRKYPWGNDWNAELCNNRDMKAQRKEMAKLEKFEDTWYGTLPVGSFPDGKSPYGVMDMAGNVSEWCLDWYDEKYYKDSIRNDPMGPSEGEERVLKGGAFYEKSKQMRCASRDDDDPEKWCNLYGFRVVIPAKSFNK